MEKQFAVKQMVDAMLRLEEAKRESKDAVESTMNAFAEANPDVSQREMKVMVAMARKMATNKIVEATEEAKVFVDLLEEFGM